MKKDGSLYILAGLALLYMLTRTSSPTGGPPHSKNPITDPRCKPYPSPIPADVQKRCVELAKTLAVNDYVKEPDAHHPGQNVFYHSEMWTTGGSGPDYKAVMPYLVDAPVEPKGK